MVKAYLNYSHKTSFSSTITNPLQRIPKVKINNILCFLVSSNEYVYAISLKTGKIEETIEYQKKNTILNVTSISTKNKFIIIGYSDGDILIYNFLTKERKIFSSHENSILFIFNLDFKNFNWIVSTSIDKKIFIWDLDLNEIIFELKNISAPVAMVNFFDGKLIVLSKDGILRLFDVNNGSLLDLQMSSKNELNFCINFEIEGAEQKDFFLVGSGDEEFLIYNLEDNGNKLEKEAKIFKREKYDKILQMEKIEDYLYCLTSNGYLEIYKFLDLAEIKKKYKRKTKRNLKNLETWENYIKNPLNHLIYQNVIKLKNNYKRFSLILEKENEKNIFFFDFTNILEKFKLNLQNFTLEENKSNSLFGHRGAINWLNLSTDDYYILSGSSESICYWESQTSKLIKKFNLRNSVNAIFLPKDTFFVYGTDQGELGLFDLENSKKVIFLDFNFLPENKGEDKKKIEIINFTIKASFGLIEILTVSSDNYVRKIILKSKKQNFGFEIVEKYKLHDRPKKVLSMNSKKNLLVSFTDNTIQLLSAEQKIKESLRFYGHALQINDFDISTDDYILATVSADKTIRIWDTDFGNCRRIINKAHPQTINKIQIIKETHYAITTGRDNFTKFWDLDNFNLIMRFNFSMGGSIRALAISSIGDYFVIGGVNKSLRIFTQTKEQVFAIELQEEMKEEEFVQKEFFEKEGDLKTEVLMKKYELKKTAEDFMDMIEDVEKYSREKQEEYENYLIIGEKRTKPTFGELNYLNPAIYVLKKFEEIRKNKLDSILVFLHFDSIVKLLYYIHYAMENQLFLNLSHYLFKFIIEKHHVNIFQSSIYTKLVMKISKKMVDIQNKIYYNENFINSALNLYLKESKYLV